MNPARRPLVAGNWKMHHGGASGVELVGAIVELARDLPHVDLVVAPPFTALAACAHECDGSRVEIAAQNVYPKDSGAFTGEVSVPMLLEAGCTWVIVGHSERRQHFGIAVLARMHVEHEVDEGALQFGAHVPIEREARAGNFGGAFQVEDAQVLAQVPVGLGFEIERGRRAPAADF